MTVGFKLARCVAGIIAATALTASAARAADIADPAPAVAVQAPAPGDSWTFISPFSPCQMNCTATLFVGRYVATPMTDIFLRFKTPPWDWRTEDSTLVAGAFNREILIYGDVIAFETEAGLGKRFGEQDEWEVWGALYARWKSFPWNDYLRTTIAVSTGLNYASGISRLEREKSEDHQSRVLHYLSPEITFGLPERPDLDLVFRFHHRSGGNLALFDGTGGGSQYQTVGLRYRW